MLVYNILIKYLKHTGQKSVSIKLHITWLFSDMNVDDITVPDPVYMKWPKNFSCQDSPTPGLKIQYEGLSIPLPNTNSAIITLTNKTAFTIPSCN